MGDAIHKARISLQFFDDEDPTPILDAVFFEEDDHVRVWGKERLIEVTGQADSIMGLKRTIDDVLSHLQVATGTQECVRGRPRK